jgi:transposase
MTSISHLDTRYLPHELKTRINAVKTYRNGNSIEYVCRKYHISRTSLWRWNKKFNESGDSLKDKSHRPLTKHPNAHTDSEIKWIKDLIRRNPHITLCELWIKLRINKGYSRHVGSLYRILRKIGFYNQILISGTSKYVPKKYEIPKMIGEKWQIDVKFVPKHYASITIPSDKRFYQYTCVDEASRERFLYWYDSANPANTVDFIKRCMLYYEYKPLEIQTDNGTEFAWNSEKMKVIHPMDEFCIKEDIYHHKIRPRTPRHNGKVERSHRNDNERFYSYLKFYSFEDLLEQGKRYLKRSNNIPMAVLGYLTPKEKRAELEVLVA